MPTASSVDKNSLKLTGNKIELVTRPKENQGTASSRCALLGRSLSRPVSAVPLLNLDYNEFDLRMSSRRPLSADVPLRFKKSYRSKLSDGRYESLYTDGTISLESSEEMEGALPSTQLLQSLLSEPLYSWRNGVRCKPSHKSKVFKKPTPRQNKMACGSNDSNETPSADSDTSSSAESIGIKPLVLEKSQPLLTPHLPSSAHLLEQLSPQLEKPQSLLRPLLEKTDPIINLEPEENKNTVNKPDTNVSMMPLVPGLKTKPPLPKKPDQLIGTKLVKKIKSPGPIANDDIASRNQSNFEKITLGMLNYDLIPSQNGSNVRNLKIDQCNRSKADVSINNHMELNQDTQPNTEHQEVNIQSSTSTLDSNNDAIELKFQNWFQEDQKVSNAIFESELNTDLSLHNLKLQQNMSGEKGLDCNKCYEVDDKTACMSNNDVLNPPPKPSSIANSSNKQNHSAKTVNFEGFDFQELKSEYEKRKKNCTGKNFIKHNIKQTSQISKKNMDSSNISSTEASKRQTKFVATQMRSFPDYSEINVGQDVESWMSSSTDIASTIKNEITNAKPTSYLDCLNKIDELQETYDLHMKDIPVHDKGDTTTDQSDANTLDDIVAILHTLEEEDKKSQIKIESIKEIVSSELSSASDTESYGKNKTHIPNYKELNDKINKISCVNFKEQHAKRETSITNCCNDCSCSSHNKVKTRDQDQPSRTSLNSSSNLKDIFSFLDEVDRNCSKSLACAKDRVQSTTQILESNVNLDTIPKLEELLAYTNVELCHHIIDLSLRLKDKSSSIALLQKELSTLRDQVTKMTKDTNEIVKQRLRTQKEDYENVVKRHQKFIDQLIADKKTLNQQCEGLIHEMKVLEDRYNSNIKATEHRHKVELQKVKEMHVAGEKIRRDRWIDTKTQKIKELTVKGLEPELEKMAARHQQELTDLRALHKREIEDLELRAARKMQQQCESLREQLIAEREKALAHEREILRQRYEQLIESEEQNYQEQRRRLLAEHANRISECEDRENVAIAERDRAIKQAQSEFEDKLQAITRRHNTELSLLKEKTELEMEAFRNNYKKQAGIQLTEKETQIRDKCRKERDKEIEAVIERLEMESSETKQQIEQSTENRIRRVKEKYEKEIKDLEQSETEASSKYSETKSKLLESEDIIITLKSSIKQLEVQLHETKEVSDKLSVERNTLKDIIREEMKQEVQALEKEVQELRNDKDKELQQVYARVKVAVARKDEALSELTRDHTALQEKCTYLENMLEQQRKEYLIK